MQHLGIEVPTRQRRRVMTDHMMDGMIWGTGHWIALIVLALVIAALVKYVFFR